MANTRTPNSRPRPPPDDAGRRSAHHARVISAHWSPRIPRRRTGRREPWRKKEKKRTKTSTPTTVSPCPAGAWHGGPQPTILSLFTAQAALAARRVPAAPVPAPCLRSGELGQQPAPRRQGPAWADAAGALNARGAWHHRNNDHLRRALIARLSPPPPPPSAKGLAPMAGRFCAAASLACLALTALVLANPAAAASAGLFLWTAAKGRGAGESQPCALGAPSLDCAGLRGLGGRGHHVLGGTPCSTHTRPPHSAFHRPML